MNWKQSDVLANASENCSTCGGTGVRADDETTPCRCVLRAVFAACLKQYRERAA